MKRYELNENEIKNVNGGYIKYENDYYVVYDNETDQALAIFKIGEEREARYFDEMMNRPKEGNKPAQKN